MTVADDIRAEEGWRPFVYADTRGFSTIGYGFLIDSRRGEGLPKEVGEFWLTYHLARLRGELVGRWPAFLRQPADVQRAVLNMAYQMGCDGVLGFKDMVAALERGDRAAAAAAAIDSKWHQQTPARAERVAALIRGDM